MDKPKSSNLPIISTRGGTFALEQIARTKAVLATLHGVESKDLATTIIDPEAKHPHGEPAPQAKDAAAG